MNASVFGNKIGKDMSQPVENKCLDFDLQEKKAKKINLRRPGIEPEPRDWETRMLTITPTTLRSCNGKNGCIYKDSKMNILAFTYQLVSSQNSFQPGFDRGRIWYTKVGKAVGLVIRTSRPGCKQKRKANYSKVQQCK